MMDSKRYFSPSNTLETNNINLLDRKITRFCFEKSKIQTSESIRDLSGQTIGPMEL